MTGAAGDPDPSGGERSPLGGGVDWALAAKTGARLVRPGPAMTPYTRAAATEELAAAARFAEQPVREVTGLADGLPVPAAMVVDRAGWIDAAAASMGQLTAGLDGQGSRDGSPGIGGRVAGVQAGAVLAFLSTAILGQYDPFTGEHGTLLLVTPNVIAVERSLKVAPKDFRLWVCLHEVTHRVQFSSAPWLADYMKSAVDLLGEDTGEPLANMAGRLAAELNRRRRGEVEPGDGGLIGLVSAAQAEPQRNAIERLLMLGTLLEGHADHVMDAVGPAVVPTVTQIRSAFDARRRRTPSPLQRIMRALLGMDAKLAQYVRGKAFVDAVVGQVGMEQFNAVWTGPETLPRRAEIDEPARWVTRVLG
ncbi:zinc-dependent metalloprotease [Rhodococcus sp. D2-41]|uniref:Zinc-dependent metalloprotease n=1 Tax=Speluncibacter jeojiensis TaxID=2710754 RepID=A0A9X4M2Z0_9ACTN|nr:zinc-dependent metalloprotease [Rhodococcus sp. D2-41]MDG3009314.1 zinc-dependent metalloprotease [Rhodococcus sp. D2-41]MDG3016899.1 zinc-dependent metalloprotease [Corynebacteriales bacterium D3-21]